MAQSLLTSREAPHRSSTSSGALTRRLLVRDLLDEPFGALDAQTRLLMQSWLLQIWSDFRKTILFVTHDIDEAIYLSDEIYIFTARPGRIKAHMIVTLRRPRDQDSVTTAAFMDLKRQLLELLNDEARIAERLDSVR